MGRILPLLEEATDGTCFGSYKYRADEDRNVPTIDYEEQQSLTVLKDKYGETDTSLKTTRDLERFANKVAKDQPLFRYFLDGSRRTYKVDDIELNRRIFPIIGGQVGVACTERKSPDRFVPKDIENNLLIALPSESNPDTGNDALFLNSLRDKINSIDRIKKSNVTFSKVLSYSSKKITMMNDGENKKYEHKGIALIQDDMIDREKKIVAQLASRNSLNQDSFLLKDGSLQYKPMKTGDYKELTKIKSNYQCVVGVSKQFNPELFLDRNGKSNAAAIANLKLYHRTPAYMFQHKYELQPYLGDYKFSIWYIRIRAAGKTESQFAGVIKVEKILITESENDKGLDSTLIDIISANLINERNPVCYGQDKRWANHLYPIYLTEEFIKSKFLSDIHFLNLF